MSYVVAIGTLKLGVELRNIFTMTEGIALLFGENETPYLKFSLLGIRFEQF